MQYHPVKIANTFIDRYSSDGEIDHLKLQKLCYYAYGWWLALRPHDEPISLFKPQVWKMGPVFYQVFASFADEKANRITRPQASEPFSDPEKFDSEDDSNPSRLVDWIWGRYGGYTGIELSDMTHKPGTPWYEIAKENNFRVPKYLEMPDDKNRAYFVGLAKKEGLI